MFSERSHSSSRFLTLSTSVSLMGVLSLSLLMTSSCTMNFVTGDKEFIDEVASIEATGGRCGPSTTNRDVGPLGDATQYRFLSFAAVLPEVLSPSGRVYYDVMGDDPEIVPTLTRITDELADVDPTKLAEGDARLAFWVNVYNALVLVDASARYAADSTFRVDTADFAFFHDIIYDVGGTLYSLNQIEQGIIRGDEFHPDVYFLDDDSKANLTAHHEAIWQGRPLDARVHFVLNCASSSCPALPPSPLRGDTLNDALESATTAFLLDESYGAGPNGISELFDFYFDDFDAEGGPEVFIARFRNVAGIDFENRLTYDWSLNRDAVPTP